MLNSTFQHFNTQQQSPLYEPLKQNKQVIETPKSEKFQTDLGKKGAKMAKRRSKTNIKKAKNTKYEAKKTEFSPQ